MAGKIFYRERVKSKDGSKSPRYRIVAVSDINLKVYADHFRKTELDQIAAATGAELIAMERGEKHR
jgi:hypothetical protein